MPGSSLAQNVVEGDMRFQKRKPAQAAARDLRPRKNVTLSDSEGCTIGDEILRRYAPQNDTHGERTAIGSPLRQSEFRVTPVTRISFHYIQTSIEMF
jgi:hypothetical protein